MLLRPETERPGKLAAKTAVGVFLGREDRTGQIQVGTAEILLDDSTRLAARAEAAGVEVELEAWEEMIHVWQALAPLVPEATEAVRRIGDWLAKRL